MVTVVASYDDGFIAEILSNSSGVRPLIKASFPFQMSEDEHLVFLVNETHLLIILCDVNNLIGLI